MQKSPSAFSKSYYENGFSIARGILPISHLNAFLQEVNCIVLNQLSFMGSRPTDADTNDLEKNLSLLLSLDKDAYVKGLRIAAKLNTLKSIVLHRSIEEHARELGLSLLISQTDPVFHVMGDSLRVPDGYHGLDPHQDWTALQGSLDLVVIWVPLVDVDKNRYPLEVIPGSHVNGIIPGTISEHVYRVDNNLIDEQAFIPVEVNRGDVVFMNGFTVHRSGKTGGDHARLACSTRFENAGEDSYVRRQYPFAQRRVIDRTIMQDNFPSRSDITELFELHLKSG